MSFHFVTEFSSRRGYSIQKTEKEKKGMIKKLKAFTKSRIAGYMLRAAVSAVFGFLTAGVRVGENAAPFGISAVGGAPPEYAAATALGAAVGYIAGGSALEALRTVSAAGIVCLIRFGTEKLFTAAKRMPVSAAGTFFAAASCSVAVSVGAGRTDELILRLCEAVMAGAGACFFSRALPLVLSDGKNGCVPFSDCVSVFYFLAVLLFSFDRFAYGLFSPSHAAAVFLLLVLIRGKKNGTSLIAGTVFGLILGTAENRGSLLFALPLSALAGGFGAEYGKPAAAAAVTVSGILAQILTGSPETAAASAAETFVSAAVFCLLPKRALNDLGRRLSAFSCDEYDNGAERLLKLRLNTAAKAVSDVGNSVREVSEMLEKSDVPGAEQIYRSVRDELCAGCVKEGLCWERAGGITEKAFVRANETLIGEGRLLPENLPQRLRMTCRSCETLAEAFNRYYCEYNARLTARSEVFETRRLAAMQFASAGDVMRDVAENTFSGFSNDPGTAKAASGVFEEFGFNADPVIAFSDGRGRRTLSAFCTAMPPDADYSELSERLFEKTGCAYMPPVADEYSDLGTVLNFSETPKFSVRVGCAVRTDGGEKRSGDANEYFTDGKGNFYVILCDGMGRGSRAAVDSVMTSSLTARLLRAGFSLDAAVRAVNAALIMKSADETLSTLDVLRVDLTDGAAKFFKAGAAFSLVRRGDRTAVAEQSTLPLGILKEAQLGTNEFRLSKGDRTVMMSDGAAVLSPAFFKECLRKMKNENARITAEYIADAAVNASPSGKNDDITVIVVDLV